MLLAGARRGPQTGWLQWVRFNHVLNCHLMRDGDEKVVLRRSRGELKAFLLYGAPVSAHVPLKQQC